MSIAKKVEDAFEEFREYLVSLVGDVHGVHSVVDDAKAALAPHIPEDKPIEVITGTSTLKEGSTLASSITTGETVPASGQKEVPLSPETGVTEGITHLDLKEAPTPTGTTTSASDTPTDDAGTSE